MSGTIRSWLPRSAAMPAAARQALAATVEDWSGDWFTGSAFRLLGGAGRVDARSRDLRTLVWHVSAAGLAIGLRTAAPVELGALVLGIAARSKDRPPADQALLARLGGECFDDLKSRALSAIAPSARPGWDEVEAGSGLDGMETWRAEIADASRGVVLVLELGGSAFAEFVRARLPAPAALPALGRADAALAPVPVRLSAELGRCSVTLAELGGLTVGDVLVLDRALDAALPLAIDGRVASRGRCAVVRHDGATALKISQSPFG